MRIVFGKDKELEKAILKGMEKEFENFLLRKLLERTMETLREEAKEDERKENIIARKDSEIAALNYELDKLKKSIADTGKSCECSETTPKKRGRKAGKNGTTKK